MPLGFKHFTEPMTPAERHELREEDKLWRSMEDRIATLEESLRSVVAWTGAIELAAPELGGAHKALWAARDVLNKKS